MHYEEKGKMTAQEKERSWKPKREPDASNSVESQRDERGGKVWVVVGQKVKSFYGQLEMSDLSKWGSPQFWAPIRGLDVARNPFWEVHTQKSQSRGIQAIIHCQCHYNKFSIPSKWITLITIETDGWSSSGVPISYPNLDSFTNLPYD